MPNQVIYRTARKPERPLPVQPAHPVGVTGRCLLPVSQVAARLGISKSLAREYLRRGILPKIRLPHPSGVGLIKRVLVDSEDLAAFIARCRESGANRHA